MNTLLASLQLSVVAAEKQQSSLASLLPLILLGGGLVYMMIVPQRKQRKKQEAMMAAMKVGDEVVTSGGIHGFITFIEDTLVHVEVDTDVVIRVSKSAVTLRGGSGVAEADAEPEEAAKEDDADDS